jgi:Tol biopolymer transport system component
MQWLMGNTTGKDWQVLGNSGIAGAKLITPFRSPSGDWTVFALSRDSAPASFSISGLPANTAFQVLIWNSNGEGKVTKGSTVNSGATGSVTVDAPAGSFLVLTTVSANPPL